MRWFGKTDGRNRQFSVKDTLEKLLKGIQATWEREEFDGGQAYTFKFQGGYFKALFSDDSAFLHLAFPCIATVGIRHLHPLREICNSYNTTTRFTKVVYTPIEAQADSLALHLETSLRLAEYSAGLQRDFQWLLELCFHDTHQLRQQVQDLENGKFQSEEEEQINRQAETALLQQLETLCLDASPDTMLTVVGEEELTVGSLMTKMWQTAPQTLVFHDLTIVTERLDHLSAHDEIRDFKVASLLTRLHFTLPTADTEVDTPQRFVRSEATGVLHFAPPDQPLQTLVLHLAAENEHSGVLSMRITMTSPEKPASPTASLDVRSERPPFHHSFLYHVYTHPYDQLRMECAYRLQEAKEAQAHGKPLTRLQRLLLRSTSADVAYNLFSGHRHLVAGEFFHAIAHLENVFYALHRTETDVLRSPHRKLFFDVCFYLGLACHKMEMWERAQFFLDFLLEVHSHGYAIVVTRNMTLLHDPRLPLYIDRSYRELVDMLKLSPGPDVPPLVQRYKHFLMCVSARLLVDKGEVAEAMQWTKALVDEGCRSENLKRLMTLLKPHADLAADKRPELLRQYELLLDTLDEEATDDALDGEG